MKAIDCVVPNSALDGLSIEEMNESFGGETSFVSYLREGMMFESLRLYDKALAAYRKALDVATFRNNRKAVTFVSFMMLGLME